MRRWLRFAPNAASDRRLITPDARRARYEHPCKPYKAGRLINQIKKFAEEVGRLPRVERSPDPGDNFLLALAQAGEAEYLVTGDKSGLLALGTHRVTRIVAARDFAALLA